MLKAALIPRDRSRHLLHYPAVADKEDIAAMAAEIERLHGKLRREKERRAVAVTIAKAAAGSATNDAGIQNVTITLTGVDPNNVEAVATKVLTDLQNMSKAGRGAAGDGEAETSANAPRPACRG